MKQMIKVGTLTGAGAAITVSLGFVPEYVRIVNVTDGNQIDEWFAGMTAGTSVQSKSAGVATNPANGVSPFAGNGTTPAGFTIGTAIALNGKSLRYIACRGDD